MALTDKRLVLKIVTPEGTAAQASCDRVRLTMADGRTGAEGGEVGIRWGHAPAVFLLAQGPTRAMLEGREVLCLYTGEGFAQTDGKSVFVTVSRAGQLPVPAQDPPAEA